MHAIACTCIIYPYVAVIYPCGFFVGCWVAQGPAVLSILLGGCPLLTTDTAHHVEQPKRDRFMLTPSGGDKCQLHQVGPGRWRWSHDTSGRWRSFPYVWEPTSLVLAGTVFGQTSLTHVLLDWNLNTYRWMKEKLLHDLSSSSLPAGKSCGDNSGIMSIH